jgi:hypothetical protein
MTVMFVAPIELADPRDALHASAAWSFTRK